MVQKIKDFLESCWWTIASIVGAFVLAILLFLSIIMDILKAVAHGETRYETTISLIKKIYDGLCEKEE